MAAALAPASPALRRWTTDVVAPAARLDYWVGAICEAFLEMDCSSRDATTFDGVLQSLPVATLSVNQVRASTQDVYRTPAGIACSRQLPFYLIAQAEAAWHVRQDGQVAHLRPGDVVLVDSARPYELHFPEGVGCVSLQLPRAWVGQWLAQAEAHGPRVAWRDQGWGQSLGALAVQLARDPASAHALPPELLSDHLGALLSAALEQPVAPASATGGLHLHLTALMSARVDQGGPDGPGAGRRGRCLAAHPAPCVCGPGQYLCGLSAPDAPGAGGRTAAPPPVGACLRGRDRSALRLCRCLPLRARLPARRGGAAGPVATRLSPGTLGTAAWHGQAISVPAFSLT